MAAEEDQTQEPSDQEENIFVSVRLRPLNERELARNDVSDWECISDTTIIYRNHLSISERSIVFGAECCTREVYEEGAKEVALSVVSGVNASVFAYGQTSSGKTYTMTGITDCTVADIYDYIEKHKEREFILRFSAMEIYNESVRDLLSTDSLLRLLDDPEKGTVVERLTEETLRDWNHFKELLSVCEAQRQNGETALNEVSSRSHQILRLTIESTARELLSNDKLSALIATVNFIDLAGSERASQSLSDGTRLKEGSHINRSLLTLGTVIRKLSKGKNGHIPFRDSKLTRILQPFLGGNARTAIICTMSPARIHVEQSRNTLLFASCAKEVTTNAQVNVVMSDRALVKHLQKELARLESELRSPGRTFVASHVAELLREKDLEIEKLKKEVLQLTKELNLTHSQIEDLQSMVGEVPEKEMLSTEDELSEASVQVVLDHQYPKLRVRSSWDSENVTPERPVSVQPSNQDTDVESSCLSPRSTEQSYDENFYQLSDFKVAILSSTAPQLLSAGTSEKINGGRLHCNKTEIKEQPHVHVEENEGQPHVHEEEFKEIVEQPDENSEDSCKEVRCIEMEKSSISRYPESNSTECSPNLYEVVSPSPACRPAKAKDEEGKVKEVKDTSLPSKEERESSKTPRHCVFSSPDKPFSERFDKDILNHRRNPTVPDFVSPSPDKPSSWLLGKDARTFRRMRLTRSRSCRARLMSGSSFSWFEKYEKGGNTPPSWYEKEFIRTSESTETTPALQYRHKNERLSPENYCTSIPATWFEKGMNSRHESVQTTPGVNRGMSSPNDSPACPSDASVFELETVNSKEKTADMRNGVNNAQKDKKIIHHRIEEMEKKSMVLPKTFKDAALDPIQDYLATPLNWPLEFKRLQREIIELWHICNVSLAHRTYFFLLFRGDQKDCLYMEVELRRLSYMKESFNRRGEGGEDGRTLTPASRKRALNQERYELSQEMQKKLTREERENLFGRWGIRLNTKNRRVQLAQRLWTETKDMEHVRESASVVGKLLGFVDMDLTSKETLSVNFSVKPRNRDRKSSRWKRSVLSLSMF